MQYTASMRALWTSQTHYAKDARELARMIQTDVYQQTGIFTTIGIGDNPLLAKFALDLESKKKFRYESRMAL